MIPISLALSLAITIWLFVQTNIWVSLVCLMVFVVLVAATLKRRFSKSVIAIFVTITILLVGIGLVGESSQLAKQSQPILVAKSFQLVNFQAQVETSANTLWHVRLERIGGSGIEPTLILLRASHVTPISGCSLSGLGRIVPFERTWILKSSSLKQDCHTQTWIDRLRTEFKKTIRGVSPDSKALVSGMAIGDPQGLSADVQTKMRTLSLTHLNAVSGANCAFVLAMVFFLLARFRISRALRAALAITVLWFYVALVGSGASVLRAAAMASIILLFTVLGRRVKPLTAMSYAVIAILLVSPEMVLEVGFQLSVLATAALLLIAPRIYATLKKRMPKWLAGSVAVSVAAQLWCLPILLTLQNSISVYAVLANLLAEPMVGAITVLGLLACAVVYPVAPLAAALSWLASVPAAWVVFVTNWLSELPFQKISWPAGVVGFVMMAAIVAALSLLMLRRARKFASAVAVIALGSIFFNASGSVIAGIRWPIDGWQIVNCNVGQGDALVIRNQSQIAVVDVGRDPELIDSCLSRLGVHEIQLLVLTHFDMDHVGGLAGALKNRQVDEGMITDYPDERPQAQAIYRELEGAARQVVRASAGLEGQLGDLHWLVLQPEVGGAGSEDANDGSISMRWDSAQYTLFTMADLPEKGQMRLVELHPSWVDTRPNVPVILKVSHHGSADQYPELIEHLRPTVALISVGLGNSYGHPTARTLKWLADAGARVERTDLQGAISVALDSSGQGVLVRTDG